MPSFLQLLSKDRDAPVEQAEFRGLARNTSDGAWLLLALAGLYVVVPGSELIRPVLLAAASGIYVVFQASLRVLPRFRRETHAKVGVELLVMIVFTTVFLFSVQTRPSLLLALYLLPVIIAALALGRWPTLLATVLSVAGFLLAALLRDPTALPAGHQIVELGISLAPFILVAYVTALLAHEIDTAKQRIRTLSETDELTGLSNLRAFSRLHRQEHERAIRHHRSYSVIVMDLDGLKQINDRFGHEAGDRAIILFANVIARLIRTTDAAARLGGDEFVVLLAETDVEHAQRVMHRIRSAVERCSIEASGRMMRLSVSVGAASFPFDGQETRALIAAADRAMYADKQGHAAAPVENEAPQPEVV